jgi:hypothetical protein
MVLPLTIFAVVLVYYNYEANRRTAYDRVLQIARGVPKVTISSIGLKVLRSRTSG